MNAGRKNLAAKFLEAIGIATVVLSLVQGIFAGDMWGELYLFLGGMLVFFIGRQMEKHSSVKGEVAEKIN